MYIPNSAMPLSNFIMTSFWETSSLADIFFLVSSSGAGQMIRFGCSSGWYGLASTSSWTLWNAPPDAGPPCGSWYKVDTVVSGSSATMYYSSAASPIGTIGADPSAPYSIASNGIYLGLVGDAGGGVSYINGLLVRAYPPGGEMPTASAGPAQKVSSICSISLSASLINFGTITPGSQSPTNYEITDTNSGDSNANILVAGLLPSGNWIGHGSNSFYVSNTAWNPTSMPAFGGNLLTPNLVDTLITVPSGSSNSIYFGLNVPARQPSDTYNSIITIENSC